MAVQKFPATRSSLVRELLNRHTSLHAQSLCSIAGAVSVRQVASYECFGGFVTR